VSSYRFSPVMFASVVQLGASLGKPEMVRNERRHITK
jgi:hypothetical protein